MGYAFPLITHHNQTYLCKFLIVDIVAFKKCTVDREVFGQRIKQYRKIHVCYIHTSYASHSCLHNLRIVGISCICATDYVLDAKPIGYTNYCAKVARILYTVKYNRKFVCKQIGINMRIERLEYGKYLLRMAQKTCFGKFVFCNFDYFAISNRSY